MKIRETSADDLGPALVLNNASLPELNELGHDELASLVEQSVISLTAEVDGAFAGFCVVLPPGQDYGSLNYAWFSRHYSAFAYLDRIAVDPAFRRYGIGRGLYTELQLRLAGSFPVLLCEVNIRPRNDASLAFHHSIGFREVGQQDTEGGKKTVSLLELEISVDPA